MSKQLQLPEDVTEKLTRLYNSKHQNWLSNTDALAWPLQIKLGVPTEREATDNESAVKEWIAAWSLWHGPGTLSWSERRWRNLGTQRLPQEISFTGPEQVAQWIGQSSRWNRAEQRFQIIGVKWPCLLNILPRFFYALAEYSDVDIARLLAVLDWFEKNAPVSLYPRQLPVYGVDTKWLERHAGIISKLLSVILNKPDDDLYKLTGFKRAPQLVRFRILDSELRKCLSGLSDITCGIAELAQLKLSIKRVFLVENDQTALCFEDLPGSIIIFGRGYLVDVIETVPWLLNTDCYYWGDLDTHGFNILNSARSHLPQLKSLLMDEETLNLHKDLWGDEEKPFQAAYLRNLSKEEHNLYLALRDNKLGERVRLEQERINWEYAWNCISRVNYAESVNLSPSMMLSRTSKSIVPIQLKASDFYTLLSPSKCDLRIYLQNKIQLVPPMSPFEEVIQRLATLHKQNHLATFSDVTELARCEQRELDTRKGVLSAQPLLHRALLKVSTTLGGIQVEISGEPDFLIREVEGYVIRNAKLARRLNDHSEIILELQLHGWLYEQIFGTPPVRLEVFSGDGRIVVIPYDKGLASVRVLAYILNMQMLNSEPDSPIGWTKCAGCTFNQYCWTKARESNDVALLVGVDQLLSTTLYRNGCHTIGQLLANFSEERLSNLQRNVDGKLVRVGKKAKAILQMARAMEVGREIVLETPILPLNSNFVMFDLEGLPPHFDESEKVYLWGMQVFGSQPGHFMPALAGFGIDGDRLGWNTFLCNAAQVFQIWGEIPFVHWHHYERTKLEMYIHRFGDETGIANRVRNNLLDLLPIVQQCLAIPVSSYSLKVVEGYIGFQRSQVDFGGDCAMAKYIEAIESKSDLDREQLVDEILIYNHEDLQATWAVFEWLRTFSAGTAVQQ